MKTENKSNTHLLAKGFLTPALRNESGMALVTVLLFVVVMLSMIPVAMQFTSGDIDRTQNFKEDREAFFVAEAGLEHAKFMIEENFLSGDELLAGPDALVNATPSHADNDDNGTFGAGTLATLDGNVYDEVAFNGNNYYIRAYDNNDDGDSLDDSDRIVILFAVGIVDGTMTTVESTIYLPAGITSGVATNGDLLISGNPTLTGSCGSVHANGDLEISANPNIQVDATASGAYTNGGSPVIGGASGSGYDDAFVPLLNPPDYEQYADYKLKSDGKVYDSNDNEIHDVNVSNWEGWSYSSA